MRRGSECDGTGHAIQIAGRDEFMAESSEIFDLEMAAERIPGGPEALKEMALLLVQESTDLLQRIHDSFESGDIKAFGLGAHTLKSAADVFGAKAVVAAALRLESMARDEDLKDAKEGIAELEEEAARLNAALTALVGSDPV